MIWSLLIVVDWAMALLASEWGIQTAYAEVALVNGEMLLDAGDYSFA
jgi:hypothetical protein